MWEGSDIIVTDRVGNFFIYTSWKLGSSLSCKLPIYNICYLHMCEGQRGGGHGRITEYACWPYHTSKHMTHSVRRRTLENMTEMRYSSVLQYKPWFSCVRQTLPVWKHNVRALLTLYIHAAHEPLTLAVWNGHKANRVFKLFITTKA